MLQRLKQYVNCDFLHSSSIKINRCHNTSIQPSMGFIFQKWMWNIKLISLMLKCYKWYNVCFFHPMASSSNYYNIHMTCCRNDMVQYTSITSWNGWMQIIMAHKVAIENITQSPFLFNCFYPWKEKIVK